MDIREYIRESIASIRRLASGDPLNLAAMIYVREIADMRPNGQAQRREVRASD